MQLVYYYIMNKKNKSLNKVQDKPANFIKKIRLN